MSLLHRNKLFSWKWNETPLNETPFQNKHFPLPLPGTHHFFPSPPKKTSLAPYWKARRPRGLAMKSRYSSLYSSPPSPLGPSCRPIFVALVVKILAKSFPLRDYQRRIIAINVGQRLQQGYCMIFVALCLFITYIFDSSAVWVHGHTTIKLELVPILFPRSASHGKNRFLWN